MERLILEALMRVVDRGANAGVATTPDHPHARALVAAFGVPEAFLAPTARDAP